MTAAPRPAENVRVHTRIIKLPLGIEESRAYWTHVDPATPPARRAVVAFEQRWFGVKSLDRIRDLLAGFVERYDAYPAALDVLRRWGDMAANTRQAICHWHLQLSDPLYRRFTGEMIPSRRGGARTGLERDVVVRWIEREFPDRWQPRTVAQIATKLRSVCTEAGLLHGRREPRTLVKPTITDEALVYLLQLLRG
ncbi:MAG: DUF1819 domain-containing protein, partial [Deltaproteobacteria bacterium]